MYYNKSVPEGMLQSKVCNSSGIRRQVVTDNCQRSPILDNHVSDADSAECIYHQITRGSLDAEDLALAVLWRRESRARGAVVIKEAVKTGAIDNDIVAVKDA